ncbi:MAG: tetratricopeptide repeat protein, partial [Terriglobales bacterium]
WIDCVGAYEAVVKKLENEPTSDYKLLGEALSRYGRMLRAVSKYALAEQVLGRAVALYEANGAGDKPEICYSLNHLALVYSIMDQHDAAQGCLDRAFKIQSEHLPAGHADLGDTLDHYSLIYHAQGNTPKAKETAEKALALRKESLGEDHEDYGDTMAKLGVYMRYMGKVDEAEELGFRAVQIREAACGADHPHVAFNLCNLAETLRKRRKYLRVEQLLLRALKIFEERVGEQTSATTSVLNSLGNFKFDHGQLNEASEYFERSYVNAEKIYGEDHPKLSLFANNLAVVYNDMKRTQDAKRMNEKAQALLRLKFMRSNEQDVETLVLLADKYFLEKNYGEALKIQDKALELATRNYGEDSLK